MQVFKTITKTLKISLVILFLLFLLSPTSAYARGGCFGSGTSILTPEGNKPVEQLHPGDRVIGFNPTTRQLETETIGDIQVLRSSDYYLINNSIRVTGTHPFYVYNGVRTKLVEAQNLKLGDQLIKLNNKHLMISSIDHIKKSITVYNLLSITPDHNFYANGVLVHNKGGGAGGGHGGGGHGIGHGNSGGYGSLLVLFLLPLAFINEINNSTWLGGKKFTNDTDLIEFVKTINPKFTNSYSTKYSKDNEIWTCTAASTELDENFYHDCISKFELIAQVSQLFIQYQNDWTRKNFTNMAVYLSQSFYEKQYDVFVNNFGGNFDIVYKPELHEVVPISYQAKDGQLAFRVQINAQMINFEITPEGLVLSGKSDPRSFTEYWDIGVDSDKYFYLLEITQVNTVSAQ